MQLQYSVFESEDGSTANATLFYDGEMYVATNQHPNWSAILERLDANDPSVVDLFDVSRVVSKKFELLSERVSVRNGRVYFDGDEVNNALTDQIIRFLEEGQDFAPLVKFYDRMAQNPNQESVEQLYRWLKSHNFTITQDGKIIGYKGVESDGNGGYRSVKSGTAIVNGEEVTGKIPNNIGFVVEMPRSAVEFNPDETCSYGLHVGTWNYAQDWGRNGAVLKVLVDPRDVVSVPSDAGGAKLRTCRYTVLEVLEAEIKESVSTYYDPFESDESTDTDENIDGDLDLCDDCGHCVCCSCDCQPTIETNSPVAWPLYCDWCNGPCRPM